MVGEEQSEKDTSKPLELMAVCERGEQRNTRLRKIKPLLP